MNGASAATGDRLLAGARLAPPRRPCASCLDARPRGSRLIPLLAAAGALGAHLVVLGAAVISERRPGAPAAVAPVTLVDIELPPPPAVLPAPEPPAPEPAPRARAQPAPRSRPVPEPPRAEPPPAPPPREAPPPAAAQAGQVLAAVAEAPGPAEAVVTGDGASYAGGTTESGGTSQRAVHDRNARAGGVEGGTGSHLAADLSRPPRLAGGVDWDCDFPPEADDAGIDEAVVTLRVEIAADGRVLSAVATDGGGHGFGRQARRCALEKRWQPGLDRAGRPMDGVALIRVRFER